MHVRAYGALFSRGVVEGTKEGKGVLSNGTRRDRNQGFLVVHGIGINRIYSSHRSILQL